MPTRAETIAAVTQIFQSAKFPQGQATPETAWLGIYQALLWYEPVRTLPGTTSLPHIIDANRLTVAPTQKGQAKVWQKYAIAAEQYLATQLSVRPDQIAGMVDRLMNLPAYRGLQRHNIVGSAFAALLKHTLEHLGHGGLTYELEVKGDAAFPGVQLPTRTGEPFIDILVRKEGRNIGIISTKWSIRHDRINDLTSECRAYKNAATWTDTHIFYYVASNEFDPARTVKLIDDKCIDGVVHVHKPLLTQICGLDGRLAGLLDLSDLIQLTSNW